MLVGGNFVIASPPSVDDGVDYCHRRIRRIDTEAINMARSVKDQCAARSGASSVTNVLTCCRRGSPRGRDFASMPIWLIGFAPSKG